MSLEIAYTPLPSTFLNAVETLAALCVGKKPQFPQAGCAGSVAQALNKSLAYFVRHKTRSAS